MLFSEPKIPQSRPNLRAVEVRDRFSALQRAENSSISRCDGDRLLHAAFQCSSASRKFLNARFRCDLQHPRVVSVLFSEPKIPQWNRAAARRLGCGLFQCSSASRKFLNVPRLSDARGRVVGFSALQRAENSSIAPRAERSYPRREFQCSSASRKFLNGVAGADYSRARRFQCSSASRKFLNRHRRAQQRNIRWIGFSALQRAENSSIGLAVFDVLRTPSFQCSSASRKFLNW